MLSHGFAGDGLRFPRHSQPGPHLPAAHSPSYVLVFPLLCLKRKGQPPRLTVSMCVDLFSLEQMAHTLDFMEGGAEECRLVGTRCLGRPSLAGNDSSSIVQPDQAGAAQEHSARLRSVSSVAPGQYIPTAVEANGLYSGGLVASDWPLPQSTSHTSPTFFLNPH